MWGRRGLLCSSNRTTRTDHHLGVALIQQPEELLLEGLRVDCSWCFALLEAIARQRGRVQEGLHGQWLLLLLLQQGLLLQQAAQEDGQSGCLSDPQQCRFRVQVAATVALAERWAARPVPRQRRRMRVLRWVHGHCFVGVFCCRASQQVLNRVNKDNSHSFSCEWLQGVGVRLFVVRWVVAWRTVSRVFDGVVYLCVLRRRQQVPSQFWMISLLETWLGTIILWV